MSERIKCAECGEEHDPEQEGSWIEGVGDVCDHCRHEAGVECAMCEERYGDEDKYWSGLVVANHEFAAAGEMWVPGFYLARGCAYSPAMIGAGTVHGGNLLYAGWGKDLVLPEMSGYVCKGCGEGHAEAARLYYGDRLKRYWRDDGTVEMESHWMRVALEAWPDLLEGHECEPEELERLWVRLGMEPGRTWSEWLLVEHRGVRVWRQWQGEEYRGCVLRPEPRYREQWLRGPDGTTVQNDQTFSVCELATYHDGCWTGVGSNFVHKWEAVRAVRDAIDRGILSQEGIDVEANVVEWEVRGGVYRDQYARLSDWHKVPRIGWPDISTLEKAWGYLLTSYHFLRPNEDDAEALAALRRGWMKGGQDGD